MDTTTPTEPTDTPTELDEARRQADEYLKGWQRAKADFVNREKEYEKQRQDFIQFALARALRSLLPVYDTLRTACATPPAENNISEWIRGIVQTGVQFQKELSALGVTRIESLGKTFDPMIHEAVGRRPAEGGVESDAIVEEVGAGYTLNGQTLVPAKVILAE